MEQKELVDINRLMNSMSCLMVEIKREVEIKHPDAIDVYQKMSKREKDFKYSIHFKINNNKQALIYIQPNMEAMLSFLIKEFSFDEEEFIERMSKEYNKSLLSLVS